ncbi:DUF397 domain-containing protein [Streptomyces hirsutus]
MRGAGGGVAEEKAPIAWQKSSYSGNSDSGGNCCEVALFAVEVRVRDSACPERAVLRFSWPAWRFAVAHFGAEPSIGGVHEQV